MVASSKKSYSLHVLTLLLLSTLLASCGQAEAKVIFHTGGNWEAEVRLLTNAQTVALCRNHIRAGEHEKIETPAPKDAR